MPLKSQSNDAPHQQDSTTSLVGEVVRSQDDFLDINASMLMLSAQQMAQYFLSEEEWHSESAILGATITDGSEPEPGKSNQVFLQEDEKFVQVGTTSVANFSCEKTGANAKIAKQASKSNSFGS